MKRLFLFFLLFSTTAGAFGSWAEKWSHGQVKPDKPEYYQYSETDIWANIWMGYSFCSFEDLRKSTTAWNNYFGSYGASSAQPDLEGLNMGLEGGWLFDGLNGISIGIENIEVSQTSYTFSTPYSSASSAIQPNVYSFSANFYHFIEQKPNSQLYLCVGAGYYLSSNSFVENVYSSGTLIQWDKGYWGGGVLGGTLGAGARINAGKNFGIQLDARGRYANFPKVTTDYTDNVTKKSYHSALAVDPNGLILQEPEGNVGSDGNKDQFLDFDFSGFDLNIGIFYHF